MIYRKTCITTLHLTTKYTLPCVNHYIADCFKISALSFVFRHHEHITFASQPALRTVFDLAATAQFIYDADWSSSTHRHRSSQVTTVIHKCPTTDYTDTCPTYKQSLQVRWVTNIPVLLHAAIYREVSLLRETSQNVFPAKQLSAKDTAVLCESDLLLWCTLSQF